MDYCIRFATKGDTAPIMRFIDAHWRKDHILSRDTELFEWQYGGEDERLNIVLGLDEEGTVQGMLGFVAYDKSEKKDIALALWKANPSAGFLGVRLLKYLMENEPYREVVCPGINVRTTSKIYEHVGMKIGTMSQWYRLAPRDRYFVAVVTDNNIPPYGYEAAGARFVRIQDTDALLNVFNFDNSEYRNSVPYKSPAYISWRYFRHPAYEYMVYGFGENGSKADTLFVFRVQDCQGFHVLRMTDCIGKCSNIKYVTAEIDDLMQEWDCEYTDFYEAGLDETVLMSAGWRKAGDEGNIIPDYFAPFEQRKVEIHYSSSSPAAILFKGDGDQDRPN